MLALKGFTHRGVCASESRQALPSGNERAFLPLPALTGTAAEFTEHEKSVSVSSANKNKTQSYKYKPDLDHEPAAEERVVYPSASAVFPAKRL